MKLTEITTGSAYRIYALSSGNRCLLTEFLINHTKTIPKEVDKLIALLDRTAEHGIPKNKTKVNTLGDGLFEFKTTGGIRVIWFYDANKIIICTHGFLKKQQTTPRKELKRAQQMKAEYTKNK